MHKPILVTGGSGFIGSNFVLDWLATENAPVVNLDKLTYASTPLTLAHLNNHDRYTFVHGDIGDERLLRDLFHTFRFSAVIHFAAESHVDRSILEPRAFLDTNIMGTYCLLQAARQHCKEVSAADRSAFRFLHVSTDEVFGTLTPEEPAFSEQTAYAPNSPYAASKAASDHLVRAWHHTYELPTLLTNCSNNYGPYQCPEKLIPLMIKHALEGKILPVYGDGKQVRDWLYVTDHCSALRTVLSSGRIGETYNVGGNNQRTNLEVVHTVCSILDELCPASPYRPHASLIEMVRDRAGHDRRYAINASKLAEELGWRPQETFASGLRKTIEWYVSNTNWTNSISNGAYDHWIDQNYAQRGLAQGTGER